MKENLMTIPDNHILVIFGASGDLTKRKLIPDVFNLKRQKLLPERFAILGVSRSEISDEDFRENIKEAIKEFGNHNPDEQMLNDFVKSIYYTSINTKAVEDFAKIKERLSELNNQHNTGENYIFYLSTPPSLYGIIPQNLGKHGLHDQSKGWKKLIVEKPFGYNLKSAVELNKTIKEYFTENQIYRIDHYLGKETVQNVLVTRFSNGIFEPLWNRNYVHHVEITSAESIGVEGRGGYYEGSGALRDMLQNHLLQLVGLVAMEAPSSFDSNSVRNETLKVFQSLRPIKKEDVAKQVIRGQYIKSKIKGEEVVGYREEEGVNPESKTETYAAVKFYIDNWRWGGVPFYIRSGKRLPTRVSEIVIHFKETPHYLFTRENHLDGCNQFVIRIQPDEGILLKFGMKVPGAGFKVQTVNMDFHYSDLSNAYIPTAYERLILDCMIGDSTLYARDDVVEAAWKFVDPILEAWEEDPSIKIYGYPAGTWGPETADDLIEEGHITWRYPCENLSDDGNYCEL